MKDRILAIGMVVVFSVSLLFSLSPITGGNPPMALAAPGRGEPVVTAIEPNEAPNDLDITVVISGEGFEENPTVYLGETELTEVTWVSETELEAVVPWGMDPGVYALMVENPEGETATLADAFTVSQGIGIWTSGGPYGGWVEYLALGDPAEETIYAILKNVGLFRSQDGGDGWELIFVEIGHENKVTVDPNNPDRLYIAKPASEKAGLYRSYDRGDTWTAMPKPVPDINIASFRAFVNPHDSTLYGALFSDLTDVVLGLFRFDETNQVWIRLEQPGLLNDTTPVTVVGFDPVDPHTLYAGLLDGTIIQSFDDGQTWTLHTLHSEAPLDFIRELVVNPVGGELWISGPLCDGAQKPGGLYKYDGDRWVSMSTSDYQFTNVRNIVFDQNAQDVNTQQVWIAAGDHGLLKSENGGQNWFNIGPYRSEAIVLSPNNSDNIFNGSTEGVQKTTDGGGSWQTINDGMTGIVPYHMGISPHDHATVFGIADSIGIFSTQDGGEVWQRHTISTGGPIVVDPVDPLHVVNADYGRFLITDDGLNFNREIPIAFPPGMSPENYLAVPNAMIARPGLWLLGVGYLDWRVPSWNYAGGGGIYLSNDGENWSWIDSIFECPPTGFGFDPVDENIMYASTSGRRGGVNCGERTFLRSEDGGQTWQESVEGLPEWAIGGLIAVEPTPPYRIFSLPFVSMDQGLTWNEVSSPAGSPINELLSLKGSPSVLYAATGAGLYRSMDGAQTWQRALGNLGKFEIWSLAGVATEDGRHIVYAATIGGVEEVDEFTSSGLRESSDALVNAGVYRLTTVFPPLFKIYLPLLGN